MSVTQVEEETEAVEESEPVAPQSRSVDNAILLLTIQDITRRLSTHRDVDTLLPVIAATAKTSLKCGECQVYFFSGEGKKLVNAISTPKTRSDYIPRTDKGMCGWVVEQRQALTRKDIESEYSLHSLLEEDPHMPDAIAPLAVVEELLGVLVVDDVAEDSQTFVRLLYILANNYALAIKNAQLFK